MIVIPKEEAYESVRNRVWFPPACENKEEHIKFLFKGCREMEIVFCKDCRHYESITDGYGMCRKRQTVLTTQREDDFCSYGERREE